MKYLSTMSLSFQVKYFYVSNRRMFLFSIIPVLRLYLRNPDFALRRLTENILGSTYLILELAVATAYLLHRVFLT